jgi:hypothetical protein
MAKARGTRDTQRPSTRRDRTWTRLLSARPAMVLRELPGTPHWPALSAGTPSCTSRLPIGRLPSASWPGSSSREAMPGTCSGSLMAGFSSSPWSLAQLPARSIVLRDRPPPSCPATSSSTGHNGTPSAACLDSPEVNDVRRVANVVGDDVGYPAPRQALPGVVFPQAGEAPLLSPPLQCEYVSCLGKFLFSCFGCSRGSEGTPCGPPSRHNFPRPQRRPRSVISGT